MPNLQETTSIVGKNIKPEKEKVWMYTIDFFNG
jgi:hypothetical protein